MNNIPHLPSLALNIAIAATLGYVNSRWVGWSFWVCFAGTSAAMMIVGWLATFEDETPGGFDRQMIRKDPYL